MEAIGGCSGPISTRGCRAPFFRKLYAVCGCGNFSLRARLRASANSFGSFFDLRSGILIFPHMYSTTKIYINNWHFYRTLEYKGEFCIIALGSTYLPLGIELTFLSTIFRNILWYLHLPRIFFLGNLRSEKYFRHKNRVCGAENLFCRKR